jgi:hypothetical protein
MAASPRESELLLLVFLAVVFAVSSTTVVASVLHIERTGLTVDGLDDGVVLTAGVVHDVGVTAADASALERVEVLVDNFPVDTRRVAERLTLKDFRPTEGSHVFVARVRATTPLMLDAQVERDFTADAGLNAP